MIPTRSLRARIAVIGYGAIGRAASAALRADEGFDFVGVVCRSPVAGLRRLRLADAVAECDLIVEAAGHRVVIDSAADILDAGVDLLVVSVGALADPELEARVRRSGPGRIFYASGAIGGLGLLTAARQLGPFETVRLVSTKKPRALLQPWMDAETSKRLERADEALEVFRGTARSAARRFPRSANVAAGLALAVDGWDSVEVVVHADPEATRTRHVVEAAGEGGRYRFEIDNTPDADNPSTSAVVAHNVVRAARVLRPRSGQVI